MVELCPKGSTAQPERGVAPGQSTDLKGPEYIRDCCWLPSARKASSCLAQQADCMSQERNNSRPTTVPHSILPPHSGPALGQSLAPTPGLTQVPLQPLVSLDELVNQGKVMGIGLIWHHPPACCNLQLPVSHQPKDEGTLRMWQGRATGTACTGLLQTENTHKLGTHSTRQTNPLS